MAIKAWQDKKREICMKESLSKIEQKSKNQKLLCERQEKSKKAFHDWLQQKQHDILDTKHNLLETKHDLLDTKHNLLDTKHNLLDPSLHKKPKQSTRPMWVNIEVPSQQERKRPTNHSSSTVLSPPNLYNDYKVYKKYAPDYFKKYKILIASGGYPPTHSNPSLDEKSSKKPKVNRCKK